MRISTHGKHVQISEPILQQKGYNCCSEEPKVPEHTVASGLCILGGQRTKDQHHTIGTCPDTAYIAFNASLDAVNSVPELEMKIPKSPEHWD